MPQDITADENSQLGPISPELVLVDPELAAKARALLDSETWSFARTVDQRRSDRDREGAAEQTVETASLDGDTAAPTTPLVTNATLIEQLSAGGTAAEPDEWQYGRARRRRRHYVAAAAVVVCVSAAAPFLFPAMRAKTNGPSRETTAGGSVPPRAAPEQQPARRERVASSASRPGDPAKTRRVPSVQKEPASRVAGRRASRIRQRITPPAPPPPRAVPRTRSTAPRPSNVLGVVAATQGGAVTIRWQPPRNAVGVVIRRRPGRGSAETTVYEGSGTAYVDQTVRNGVAYRYTIVTKGRRGTRSTGVPVLVKPRTSD